MINKAPDNKPYTLAIRVYYEDTDAGGVVYHSNYLNFFERTRTEWLRGLGYEQDELRQQENIIFVVRNANITYLKPAHFNDMVLATAEIKKMGRSSIEIYQQLFRDNQDESPELLSTANIIIVCVDAIKFKPIRIPDAIRMAME